MKKLLLSIINCVIKEDSVIINYYINLVLFHGTTKKQGTSCFIFVKEEGSK